MSKAKEIRKLHGKTIKRIELRAFHDGTQSNAWTYDPAFIFTDGTRLQLWTHETEIGYYGIEFVIRFPQEGE